MIDELRDGIKESRSVKQYFQEEGIVEDQRLSLLKWRDRADGWTALNLAVMEKNSVAVAEILELLPCEEIWPYLKILTKKSNTAVQIAARWNNVEILEIIFNLAKQSPSSAQCIKDLLLNQNEEGKNAILCAADYNQLQAVKFLIKVAQEASQNNWLVRKMLQVQENNGRSILHVLSQFSSCTKILTLILKSLTCLEQCEQLFNLQDCQGNTVFHRFALHRQVCGLKCLLKCMVGFRTISVLLKPNDIGQIPSDLAIYPQNKSCLRWAEGVTDNYYFFPTPPAFVIMYNTVDRHGSVTEKDSIQSVIRDELNIEPTIVENPTTMQVFDSIKGSIESAGGPEASGIIIILMSHGEAGSFQTSDGDVLIQEVITQMCHPDLDGKPKALFLQACQHRSSQQAQAEDRTRIEATNRSDPRPVIRYPIQETATQPSGIIDSTALEQRNLFSLQQRHCLVLSTSVNGGVAIRNTMIPALAHYLSESSADDDIYSIFLKAHYSVQSDSDVKSSGMVPEFRSTLDKKLSLKKIFREDSGCSQERDNTSCAVM